MTKRINHFDIYYAYQPSKIPVRVKLVRLNDLIVNNKYTADRYAFLFRYSY